MDGFSIQIDLQFVFCLDFQPGSLEAGDFLMLPFPTDSHEIVREGDQLLGLEVRYDQDIEQTIVQKGLGTDLETTARLPAVANGQC